MLSTKGEAMFEGMYLPALFAALYVFNFEYQEEMASTFEFIQMWSLDFNTLKTFHLDSD